MHEKVHKKCLNVAEWLGGAGVLLGGEKMALR